MACSKILPINGRLDDRVNCALNEDKTTGDNRMVFRSAINCNVETAFEDMQNTKQRWNKESGRLGYYLIHSFKPGEIDPETAHEIGILLAQELFGNRYEVIIGTHLDKEHICNHIIFNSVSFVDGRRYRNKLGEYFYDIRGASDRICREHGLSVIMED